MCLCGKTSNFSFQNHFSKMQWKNNPAAVGDFLPRNPHRSKRQTVVKKLKNILLSQLIVRQFCPKKKGDFMFLLAAVFVNIFKNLDKLHVQNFGLKFFPDFAANGFGCWFAKFDSAAGQSEKIIIFKFLSKFLHQNAVAIFQ